MMKNFEFLFPITTKAKDRFNHSGDLRVEAFVDDSGLIGIQSIFYELTDVLPVIDFLERVSMTPLFVPICDAARNAYESIISETN